MRTKFYHRPDNTMELQLLLQNETVPVVFIAGATDLLVQARENEPFSEYAAYDLTAIPALRMISEEKEAITVGSMATFTQIMESPLVAAYAPVLATAASEIGAVQLRNRATIGGNVANASPAGDTLGPLGVLDATVMLNHMGTHREVRFLDFFESTGETVLREKEYIEAFRIPKLSSDAVYRFYKVGRRNAMAISRLTLTLIASFSGEDTVTDLRVAIGAAFKRPMRFFELEASAVGRPLDDTTIDRLSRAFSGTLPQIAGKRASTAYKQPVCRLSCARLLREMRDEYESRTH